MNSKNAVSPVIASILFLAITVIISIAMFNFLQNYTQDTSNSLSENQFLGDFEIQHIFLNSIIINSKNDFNLSLLQIQDKDGNNMCIFRGDINVSNNGLVGWWKFDEIINNSGTLIVEDLSGNGNNGTLYDNNITNGDGNTTPQLIKSNNGNALQFDGIDDYVEVLDSNSIDSTLSVSVVLRQTQSGFNSNYVRYIFAKSTTYFPLIGFHPNVDTFQFINISGNSVRFFFDSIQKNKQYHLVLLLNDSLNTSLYSNNVLKNQVLQNTGTFNNVNNLYFGGGFENRFFKVEIDEIRVYNRTLSQNEIKKLYWNSINSQLNGISEIDISSCNLQKNQKYEIEMIANGEIIQVSKYAN